MDIQQDIVGVLLLTCFASLASCQKDVAIAFLKQYNAEAPRHSFATSEKSWAYATNLTKYNQQQSVQSELDYGKYMQEVQVNASKIKLDDADADTKRQFKLILSSAKLSDENARKELANLVAEMEDIYSKGCFNAAPSDMPTLKLNETKCLRLDADLVPLLRKSRNYSELMLAWEGWRSATGPKIKPLYEKFVELSNKGAKENKWADYGEYLRSWYEYDDLRGLAESLYNDLKPFYEELHAYVRFRLSKVYPEVSNDGTIPAHLFGNMWSQEWGSIYDLVVPFRDEPNLDITENLKKKYTVKTMFEEAERFFVSIDGPKLPDSFWTKTMFVDPKKIDGRDATCHASAWDFSINKDVRVKMCTQINQDDFITIHHELGHVYYYLYYWNQPFEYRTGANPGFHEAVGDTLALSVQTPGHLYKLGLLDELPKDSKSDINFLMKSALEKIAFVPFGYLIDQWRWDVYSNDIHPSKYNEMWWKLRTKYQGIHAPVPRSEKDFDPGAKYHVPANTPYIRYFFSTILQFQFHAAACKEKGHTGDLYKCSIYQSKTAGKKIGDMLALGKSKPWPEAYKALTGTDKLTSSAIREYFAPLQKWMAEQRAKEGYKLGWDKGSNGACSALVSLATVSLSVLLAFVVV